MSHRRKTRREFLRAATAAATAPYVITSAALGGPGRLPASERIGLGFVGLGGRGLGIMRHFLGRDAVCVAVCDTWADRLRRAKARGGGQCAAYGDFRELLARDDVDAVVIAGPEHWHVPHSIAAAKAGKDAFCEKPLAVTVAEGRAFSRTFERYGRVFQHGTQLRSGGNFRRACELVRNGRIGKLHTIRVGGQGGGGGGLRRPRPVPEGLDYEMWTGPAPRLPYVGQCGSCHAWGFRSEYSPGWVSGHGIHDVDIAQWGHGTERTGPVTVEGRGRFPADGFNDTAVTWHVEYAFADGVRMIYTSTNETPHGVRFEGDAGWVYVDHGGGLHADPPGMLRSAIGPGEVHLYRSPGHARDFLRAVRTRRPTIAPAEVAHRSTSICLLGDIAMRLGRKLRWDPDRERFHDDPAANALLARPARPPWRM